MAAFTLTPELLAFLLSNDANLTALKALIMEKADRTPFFMEEVVQTLAEEGALLGDRGNFHLGDGANGVAHISDRPRRAGRCRLGKIMRSTHRAVAWVPRGPIWGGCGRVGSIVQEG